MVERLRAHRRRTRLVVLAAALAAVLVSAAASAAAARPATAGASASGGTVTYALQAGVPINYIFPVMSSQYVNKSNLSPFQDLMWRPLYWWDGTPYKLNVQRSLASPPVYKNHDKDVVITLKRNWKFSNGERLTPKNVALFLGMLQTDRTNFWMYLPGAFPDTLASVSYDNAHNSFTLHLKNSVNPTWFTQNQLTMISPLPSAWDIKGPGQKASCSSYSASVQAKECPLVYAYLAKQASDTSTYASNPLWQIVDGPFKISKFTAGGTSATLVPNTAYSGSPKPRISQLVLDVATSDAAEYNLLKSHALTIGYVPFSSAPVKPVGAALPPTNPVPGYTFEKPIATWSYNDLFWNYNNPTFGPLVRQLYFRQAMQSLVDQEGDIQAALRGYGFVDFGPNPPQPPNPFETAYEKSRPYPFSIDAARKYLEKDGWNVPKSGTATCVRPGTGAGECGAGIKQGESMPEIKLLYSTGSTAWALEMTSLQSAAEQVGIKITPVATPESNMAQYFAGCTPKQRACQWQMMYLGSPETDTFTFYPETGVVFRTHAIFNVSNYANPYVMSLFDQIYSKPGDAALNKLDDYLTRTAALLWAPVPTGLLFAADPKLKGFAPSPIDIIEPENWYFAK
jgi:peptide/nickel transport system substrate-binding protein